MNDVKTKQDSKRSVTVSDVAKAAGVSVASVSRVLNNTGRVGRATRERILEVAKELEYTPNVAARALALGRSRAIGAVIPSLENLNFAIAVDALRSELRSLGYTLLLADSDYDLDKEEEQVRALVAQGVDAVMLIGSTHHARVAAFLKARNVPLLLTWTSRNDNVKLGLTEPTIGFDNAEAARQAVAYLLDLGHRRIGVIAGGIEHSDRAALRVNAVRSILAERGLPPPLERFAQRPHLLSEGKSAFRLMMREAEPPTAVLCMNDVLAYGACVSAREMGLEIPADISIVGFDDIELSAALQPALTTVRVPARAIGEHAARYLVQTLEGESPALPPSLVAELIIRDSAAAPRNAAKGPAQQ